MPLSSIFNVIDWYSLDFIDWFHFHSFDSNFRAAFSCLAQRTCDLLFFACMSSRYFEEQGIDKASLWWHGVAHLLGPDTFDGEPMTVDPVPSKTGALAGSQWPIDFFFFLFKLLLGWFVKIDFFLFEIVSGDFNLLRISKELRRVCEDVWRSWTCRRSSSSV